MTKQLAVAGILADPDWAETTDNMEHDIVNPAVYQTLRDAMKGKPARQFTAPAGKIVLGDQRAIPGGWNVPSVEAARVAAARAPASRSRSTTSRSPRRARPARSPAPRPRAARSRAAS